jgi:hypothetical protein
MGEISPELRAAGGRFAVEYNANTILAHQPDAAVIIAARVNQAAVAAGGAPPGMEQWGRECADHVDATGSDPCAVCGGPLVSLFRLAPAASMEA